MNHRTPAEERLAAANAARKPVAEMSNEELTDLLDHLSGGDMRQLLTFIAGFSPDALDASLAAIGRPAVLPRVHLHLFGQDGICTLCGTDIVTWSQAQGDAELDHIAIEGTLS